MKFSTREDIEVPIERVFAAATDFDNFERLILRRGGSIQRQDDRTTPGVGMRWSVGFKFRGRKRQAEAEVVQFDPHEDFSIESKSGGVLIYMDLSLVELSPTRTRLILGVDLKPKSMSARLLLQSMKLAQSSLTTKFKMRVSEFAHKIEREYKSAA